MSYHTCQLTDADSGLTLYELVGPGGSRAQIAPALGGNCVAWRTSGRDVLFAPPLSELKERSTRGGIPILFPFPNRIRDGAFIWAGKSYQLERNDSTKKNAIHGFSPRAAWTVASQSADKSHAALTIQFDLPELWPAPGRLTIRILLAEGMLQYESSVEATGPTPLPFGLGFHPYFAIGAGDRIETPARSRWELDSGVPTGTLLPLAGEFDLQTPRQVDRLTLDDVYTDFPEGTPDAAGLVERGRVLYAEGRSLVVRATPAFRELVLFTPPHRKAVCLEPYTCPTDAVNLTNRGMDVGWMTLPPGSRWQGMVQYVISG